MHVGQVSVSDPRPEADLSRTFTAIIVPEGVCLIFSTTPYAPLPNSSMGSRCAESHSMVCEPMVIVV